MYGVLSVLDKAPRVLCAPLVGTLRWLGSPSSVTPPATESFLSPYPLRVRFPPTNLESCFGLDFDICLTSVLRQWIHVTQVAKAWVRRERIKLPSLQPT